MYYNNKSTIFYFGPLPTMKQLSKLSYLLIVIILNVKFMTVLIQKATLKCCHKKLKLKHSIPSTAILGMLIKSLAPACLPLLCSTVYAVLCCSTTEKSAGSILRALRPGGCCGGCCGGGGGGRWVVVGGGGGACPVVYYGKRRS